MTSKVDHELAKPAPTSDWVGWRNAIRDPHRQANAHYPNSTNLLQNTLAKNSILQYGCFSVT